MRKAVFPAILIFLAAATAFAVCPQPNLLVDGIPGDMTGACAGAIDFSSAQYSLTGTGSSGGSGAGNPGGTLKVTKYFDSSSPKLMLACVNGQHIATVTLSYPSGTNSAMIKFKTVLVTSVNENVNPTSEAVEFKYQSIEIITGGTQTTTSVIGSARASTLAVAVIGGDGKSQPASHLSLTVRPGGTTFNSVQLAPTPTAPRGGTTKAAPSESLSFNYGKIEFRSANGGTANFQFSGGTLVNGNLRASRVNFTPTAGVLRR